MFLGKTLYSHGASLHPGVFKWVPAKCWGQPCDGLASHPGGSINTPSRFMLMKPEISAGLMGLLARKQRLLIGLSGVQFGL